MTGTLRCPRCTIACSAGKIFLDARSPVAPKKTRASAWETCIASSSFGGFFQVSTELIAQSREQFICEICLAARAKTLIQGGRQDVNGHGLVDGGLNRPAPLARVRNPPREFRQSRIRDQGGRREIQQPRRDHTAAPPHLRDVREIELVLVVFGVAQWRRLSIDRVFLLAHVGGTQHAQPLGVRGHEAVLDPVVHHFDEVAGAVWPAMEIPLLGGASGLFTPRRARYVAHAWSQRGKDWIEVFDYLLLATNHHAVPALQSPDATARSHIYIMDSLRREFLGAPDIVNVIGIAAVDQHVLCLKMGQEIGDSFVHHRRRNHQPDRPRLGELLYEVAQRGGANCLLFRQLRHRFRRHVEDHALMAAVEKPPRHVRAHSSKTNHADLHRVFLLRNRFSDSYLVWCPGSSIKKSELHSPSFPRRRESSF